MLDHIRNHRESPTSEVLASPLGLALARDTYANADPANLLQPELTTPRAVLTNLLGAFLEHAYPERHSRDRAIHWLSWIASHMSAGSATGSRDLAWWYLPGRIPKRQLSSMAGMGVGLLVMGVSILTELPSQGISYATTYGPQNADLWWPSWLVTSALWALSAGSIAGLVAGLLAAWSRGRTRSPQILSPRLPRLRDLPLMLRTALTTGAITVLTPTLFLGLLVALLKLLGVPVQMGNTYQELFEWYTMLGVTLAALAAVLRLWRTPVEDLSAGTPFSTYRADRRAARTVALFFGVAAGAAYFAVGGLMQAQFHKGEPFWPSLIAGLFQALEIGAAFGIVAWVAAGMTPQVRFLQLALRVRRHGRVQFIQLLEDALARQVLRQAGTMYQFRHAALQDYFTKQTVNYRDDGSLRCHARDVVRISRALYLYVLHPVLLAAGVDPGAVRGSIVRFSAVGTGLYVVTLGIAVDSARAWGRKRGRMVLRRAYELSDKGRLAIRCFRPNVVID